MCLRQKIKLSVIDQTPRVLFRGCIVNGMSPSVQGPVAPDVANLAAQQGRTCIAAAGVAPVNLLPQRGEGQDILLGDPGARRAVQRELYRKQSLQFRIAVLDRPPGLGLNAHLARTGATIRRCCFGVKFEVTLLFRICRPTSTHFAHFERGVNVQDVLP